MQGKALPRFESPTLTQRMRSMLGVDFYRLFHTPMYYIFLAIAAIIPAMVVSMAGMGGPDGMAQAAPLYTNMWNIIAADTPLYVVRDIGDYANMNMVFIFGGIMVSIFIGHDYRSGYVKQLFTTHAKKLDYMLSKSIVCAFAMACMCGAYLLGGMAGGILAGLDMDVNVGSLLIALLGKAVMSLGWASLYTFINVVLRRYFGVSITLSFILGTGMPALSSERNILSEYYDELNGKGFQYAYTYPGMNLVLQAAGRVIRDERDRGVVVLVDDRYAQPEMMRLFPAHWTDIRAAGDPKSLHERLLRFWNEKEE